ncbi:MAG: signal peptidase I [Spirochaetaceae bacterium]|jgi:signal peptidase I|nr:signal peptidase I [Spirochaetaceae bacterium]
MFNKWEKYSYADQKNHAKRIRTFILRVALVIIVYILITNIFFPMIVMESSSMRPSVYAGDRFVFSAFNLRRFLPQLPWESVPYERGNIVMVDMAEKNENGFALNVFDKIFRFFTLGKLGFPGKKNQVFIKRVIGLPGDEITMINYVIQVHPVDSPYTLTEYEVSRKHYQVDIPQVSALWDESIPFSGNMERIVLSEDQCFVLSDMRANTNDSRTWGPLDIRQIAGAALFRYWPPSRVGVP